MNEPATDPMILYVLMRTDLPDYVPGKSMAQANHAGTQFMQEVGACVIVQGRDIPLVERFTEWADEAGGFGTCIVLGVTYPQLITRIALCDALGHLNGIVFDPTYPLRDGHQMQTLPVNTCGWVFGRKSELDPALGDLRLFA